MSTLTLSSSLRERMHRVLEGHVERGGIPGLVALVSRGDEVHLETVGATALRGGDAMMRDTIFRISSMTKPITAVAAMILVEECTLRLDDPVDRFLPELSDRRVLRRIDGPVDETVPAVRPITLRDLLTFRMGFGQLFASPDAYPILRAAHDWSIGMGPPMPATMPPPEEWMRRLGGLPLMCQPGERWLYNTGADVLGVLIARASGRPFEAFLRERVFEPLGMRDTGFAVPAGSVDRLATSYWLDPATGAPDVYDPAAGGQWSRAPAFPSGAGGLVSTGDDYLAFARMLRGGGKLGGARILSRGSVEVMTTDHLTSAQKAVSGLVPGYFDGHGWGFGMSVVTRRDEAAGGVGTYGWDGGLGTSWYTDPREELTAILMTQCAWTSPSPPEVSRDFRTLAWQAIDD